MPEAYIVDAVRTAGGRKGGALKDWHPADMAAQVLNALVDRSGLDPAAIDDVITEIIASDITERGATRADDKFSEAAMEDRKREGYF